MGSRGPLKIPPHLRPVEPHGEKPPDPTAADRVRLSAPKRPRGLPREVGALWNVIVPALDEAGLISPVDGPTVELALRHFVQARKASDELLKAESVVIHDAKNGRDAKHPASQVMRDHSAEFLKYAAQLGLSYTARARVALPAEESSESNPFAG